MTGEGHQVLPGSHRQHGTYVKYVQDRCRCDECRAANRDYKRQRSARIAPPYVSAQPARAHIEWLATQGVGLKTVAKVSGVAHGALWKIVYGVPSIGRPPSKRIRPETSEKILAVTPADIADGGRVDAGPSWAVLDQLIASGMPKVEIARRLGQTGPGLQLSRNQILARHARTIAAMKREWEAGGLTYARRSRHGDQVVTVPPPSAEPTHDPDAVDRAHAAPATATASMSNRSTTTAITSPCAWSPSSRTASTSATGARGQRAEPSRRGCSSPHAATR